MSVSVYLSNENIAVVKGKVKNNYIKVKSFYTLPIPEEAWINGMIINDDKMHSAMKQLRSKHIIPRKNVRLIIDRSSILVKFIKIPKIKKRHIIGHIKNAFEGATQSHEVLIYDYSVLQRSKSKDEPGLILASAIEKSLIESYMNLFKSVGIKLSSIDIALNSILKFHNYCKDYQNNTFIVTFLDADSVFSLLFINGKYKFSNRSRLIAKRGTMESVTELGNFLSSFIQFNKTQKTKQDIEMALFCGLQESEAGLCEELSSMLSLKVEPFVKCPAIIPVKKIKKREPELLNNLFAVSNLIK